MCEVSQENFKRGLGKVPKIHKNYSAKKTCCFIRLIRSFFMSYWQADPNRTIYSAKKTCCFNRLNRTFFMAYWQADPNRTIYSAKKTCCFNRLVRTIIIIFSASKGLKIVRKRKCFWCEKSTFIKIETNLVKIVFYMITNLTKPKIMETHVCRSFKQENGAEKKAWQRFHTKIVRE